MHLSLIVLYVPAPTLDHSARFYGALLDAAPVRAPGHWSVTGGGLSVELHPADQRPATATRLEWTGDADAAVERLIERAHALPERHRAGGWWVTDPCGNTVRLLGG